MRLIKMLGLSMVAALAAMAFVGAGSALATSTELCSAHPEGSQCKAGTLLSGLLNIDGLQILGEGKLLTSLGDIRCLNGHINAHIPNANLATTLLGKVKVFSYLECESFLFGCSGRVALVKTEVEPEFHLLYTAVNLGTLSILKPSTTVKIHCSFGTIECKFAENDTVTGTIHNLHEGLPRGVVVFKETPITGPGGGLCPKTGKLDTTFKLNYLDGLTEKLVFIAS